MNQYIKNLIAHGENQHLDFKYEISDSKKIARTFSAFANTDGGILLIGVKDNGIIKGIQSDEEIYMVESAAHIFCKPRVQYSIEQWHIDGRAILEVNIPKSENIPHFALLKDEEWIAYIRVNDENFMVDHIQIKVWKNKTRKKAAFIKYKREEEELLKYLNEHKDISFNQIKKRLRINKFIAQKILVNLISIDIIKIVYSKYGFKYQLI